MKTKKAALIKEITIKSNTSPTAVVYDFMFDKEAAKVNMSDVADLYTSNTTVLLFSAGEENKRKYYRLEMSLSNLLDLREKINNAISKSKNAMAKIEQVEILRKLRY